MSTNHALILALVLSLGLLLTQPITATTETFAFAISPEVAFKLPAYGTVIRFSETLYCDSWEWDSLNATYIKFNRVKMDGDTLDYLYISAQGANITIEDLMAWNKIRLTATLPPGSLGIIVLQLPPAYGMPGYVKISNTIYTRPAPTKDEFDTTDGDTWYYDIAGRYIYVKVLGHSPVEVTIAWWWASAPSPPPEEEKPAPSPPAPVLLMPSEQLLWALALLAGITVAVFLASRRRRQ